MANAEEAAALQGKLVWSPSAPQTSRMERFRLAINKQYGLDLRNYDGLWRWSCTHLSEFWAAVWEETGTVASQKWDTVLPLDAPIYPAPLWFQGARLNFAENLLRFRSEEKLAVIQSTEVDATTGALAERSVTQAELYALVSRAVQALRARGVRPHDRVASYASNCIENLVAFLAASAVGAVWCSAAADFGPAGVLERLRTVRPRILFSVNAVRYNGKVHDHTSKLAEVVRGLDEGRKDDEQRLEEVVLIPYVEEHPRGDQAQGWTSWDDFLKAGSPAQDIEFEQLDFNHPLWILFSSGTTGKPKAITHRAGGMLLQLAKEHLIHGDLGPSDVFFQHTTTGWMMWNFLIAGLVAGCTIVLYDGSPLRPPSVLWDLAVKHGVTVFGTSAAYLAALEKSGYLPNTQDVSKIKQILSTGSPLRAPLYPFIHRAIHKDILIGSVTGGTDLCSLFAGHNTALPVRAGEIQACNLGMDLDVFDEQGRSLPAGAEGDLVCKKPFPAQPLGFWQQPESKYFESYYAQFPGVWYHGDYVSLSENGGLVMLGRSDGILNPGGIRFGSSEIYELLEERSANFASSLADIEDSLVVALKTPAGDDEVVVLFLVVKAGSGSDSASGWEALEKEVKTLIRVRRSARHVPRFVRRVQGVPHTLNGKRVEVPVKKLINGAPLSTINRATLQNAQLLHEYVLLGEQLRKEMTLS